MAQLTCTKCGGKKSVPHVHDGPGVISKKKVNELVCPTHGEGCMPTPIPNCCGVLMRYTA